MGLRFRLLLYCPYRFSSRCSPWIGDRRGLLVDEVCITSPHLACIARTAPHFHIIIICPKKRTCRRDMAVIFAYHFSLSIPRMLTIYVLFFGFCEADLRERMCVCACVCQKKGPSLLPRAIDRSLPRRRDAGAKLRLADALRFALPLRFVGGPQSFGTCYEPSRALARQKNHYSVMSTLGIRKAPARRRCWPLQDENG